MAVSQTAQIAALLKTLEPRIRDAFLEAMQKAKGSIDRAALIDALARGDVERAVQMLRINQALLFPLEDAIRAGYVAGGQSVLSSLPRSIAGVFGFDGRAYRAEAWMQRHGAELVQGITDDTLVMARVVITAGLAEGSGPATVARSITGKMVGGRREGGFLGLTAQQADSIVSGRAKLLSGNPALMAEYLELKLRNKNFDALIKRAMAGKAKLSVTEVDRIIEAHKGKALAYRGELIAKTEAFTAQAAGRAESYRQVLERADVETVTVRWQHNLSERPRLDHVAMDGTVIELGQTFNFPDGARMQYPHDPAGGAKHSLGCRCVAIYRVKVAKD